MRRNPATLSAAAGQAPPVDPSAPVRRMPTWGEIRRRACQMDVFEFAGVPVPIEMARLVVAPGHPYYERLNGVKLGENGARVKPEHEGLEHVNSWYCHKTRRRIYVMHENGRAVHGWIQDGPVQRLGSIIDCIGVSMTMDNAAEEKALALLGTLIKPHMLDAYRLTGAFFETSARSGVAYIFRRCATTLAFHSGEKDSKFLAALCLHPIAYYEGLPIGTMVPTDDVIAHLVMMRADEHMFWRKANQHGALSPGAQL